MDHLHHMMMCLHTVSITLEMDHPLLHTALLPDSSCLCDL